MKIAGVTMTFNDGYKIKEWYSHYATYRRQLDYYIIVDNNSDEKYKDELKKIFSGETIIERTSNGGCTAAYNDGIRYALEHTDADAIVIIGNDVKLTPNCIHAMYEYLYSDETLGVVSTAILHKDSNIIDCYGHIIKKNSLIYCDSGVDIHNVTELSRYTDIVTGGFNMAKREFYEKGGLQDEALFMYCDESDTAYKARKLGYRLGVIANEYAWHWHINPPSQGHRSSASRYLICRNRIYLAKKHEKIDVILFQIYRGIIKVPLVYIYRYFRYHKIAELKDAWYSFVGGVHGIIGYMKYNDYMDFNK